MCFEASAGEPGSNSAPKLAILFLKSGSFRTPRKALFSFSMTGAGVALGATSDYHNATS